MTRILRRLPHFALVVPLVVTLPFTTGCSLLGLAIGSQIPHYEKVAHVTRGDAVYLEMDDGDVVHGAAVAVDATTVTVLPAELGKRPRDRIVALVHVKTASRRRGSEWLSTFIIGLVVDTVAGGFTALGLAARH